MYFIRPATSYIFLHSLHLRYAGADGETVTESCPTADPESSPRIARLVNAESACREKGGTCLRLAGLYNLDRGAHNFWLTSGKDINGRDDGIVNLLHYDDAAGACLAALSRGREAVSGKVLLVSDGNPTTRRGICESAIKASLYKDKVIPAFLGGESDPKGKVYDGTVTNELLQWKPRYESFDAFMSSQ